MTWVLFMLMHLPTRAERAAAVLARLDSPINFTHIHDPLPSGPRVIVVESSPFAWGPPLPAPVHDDAPIVHYYPFMVNAPWTIGGPYAPATADRRHPGRVPRNPR